MPKPKHSIDDKILSQLRQDLQSTMGMIVRNRPDTEQFSNRVRKINDVYISPSTFSRLFLNAEAANHFYLDTLDKLSSLVYPYSTWDEYCRIYESSQEQLKQIGVYQMNNPKVNLVGLNLSTTSWKPLHLLFEEMSYDKSFIDSYRFMYDFGQSFYDILNWAPKSEMDFYKRFINYPIIKKAFFELNADPDFTLPNYIRGLDYYIKGIDMNTAVSKNDLLFALSLKYYFYLKNVDLRNMQLTFNQINSVQQFNELLLVEIHPFNTGRYLSARLYNAFYFDSKFVDPIVIDCLQWIQDHFEEHDAYGIRVIVYHLLEAFMHCKVAQFYTDKLMLFINGEHDLNSHSAFIQQTIYNLEPSGIRWTRRFKSQVVNLNRLESA
jgi:hypothetical protein